MDTITEYLDPERIETIATVVAGAIVAVGAAVGRIRRAVIQACRRALGRTPPQAMILAALLPVALGACTGPGGRLGETDMRSEFQDVPDIIAAIGDACPECGGEVYTAALAAIPDSITYRDGKDKADISAELAIGGGGFTYSAADEDATSPAEVRARIAESVGDDAVAAIEGAFPGGISGLVEILTGGGAGE